MKPAGLHHITMITGDGARAISLGWIAIGKVLWLPLRTDDAAQLLADAAQRLATCDVSEYTQEGR